jgi:protease secretion system membrane fusion protein
MSDVIDVVSKEKVVQAPKDDFPDLPTDAKRPLRIGLWVLFIGFGGFLLWAALAPLGEGVPAQASVAIDNRRKTVQHLTGGVVKRILVKEGQSFFWRKF